MVELWVRFDVADKEIINGLYLDVMLLTAEPLASTIKEAGLPDLWDLIGLSKEENAIINESAPPSHQKPWGPEVCPWFEPEIGLKIHDSVIQDLKEKPGKYKDWEGMETDVRQLLSELKTAMLRAKERRARFQLFTSTF